MGRCLGVFWFFGVLGRFRRFVFVFFFCCYFVPVTVAAADFILHLLGKELAVCVWIAGTAAEDFTLRFTRCLFPSQLSSLCYL